MLTRLPELITAVYFCSDLNRPNKQFRYNVIPREINTIVRTHFYLYFFVATNGGKRILRCCIWDVVLSANIFKELFIGYDPSARAFSTLVYMWSKCLPRALIR